MGPEHFPGEHRKQQGVDQINTIYFNTLCSGGQVGPKPQPKIPYNSIFPEFVQEFVMWY